MRAEGDLEPSLSVLAMRSSEDRGQRYFICREEGNHISRQLKHHWPGEGHPEDPTQAS